MAEVGSLPQAAGDQLSALVLAAQAGQPDAQRKLYLQFAPVVVRLAHNTTRSSDLAKDVTQDTFITAFAELQKLKNPEAFKSWLLQIAVSRCRRHFRTEKLKRMLGLDSVGDMPEGPLLADHLRSEARAEVGKALKVIAKLPFDQRSAWLLRHVEEYSLPETAEALGCSLATVKRWLAAADAHVATQMEVA